MILNSQALYHPILSLTAAPAGYVIVAGGSFSYLSAFALYGYNDDSDAVKFDSVAKAYLPSHHHRHHDVSLAEDDDVTDIKNDNRHGVADLLWSSDATVIFSAGWDGCTRVWDGRRKYQSLLQPVTSLKCYDGSVTTLAYKQSYSQSQYRDDQAQGQGRSTDRPIVATGGRDTTIALWEASFIENRKSEDK